MFMQWNDGRVYIGMYKKDKKEAMDFKKAEKKTAFFEDGLENVLETGGNENEEN